MKVQIEGIIHNWADEIPTIIVRVINAISISENKEELQTALLQISQETELDKFFVYGYGAYHFWLTHRRLSNGEPMDTDYSLLNFEDMERKVYRVHTQYIFEGVFEVAATTREEAERKILEDCGIVMGRGVHSILPDEQINWAFDTHPEERIIETTEIP